MLFGGCELVSHLGRHVLPRDVHVYVKSTTHCLAREYCTLRTSSYTMVVKVITVHLKITMIMTPMSISV